MAETAPQLPSELPVLPLRRTVALPLTLQPLAVNRPVSIETVNRALGADRLVLLVLQSNENEDPGPDDLLQVGTVGVIRQIAENSGVEGSIVVSRVLANKSQSFGFDAQSEEYVDMLSAGIVDPAKVVRVALQDAASIAGLLITTEAMVAEAPKRDGGAAMPGGGGGMGGMGGMDF